MVEHKGLYSTDGNFRSDDQIKRELALDGQLPVYQTPIKYPRTADEYLAQAQELADIYKENAPQSDNFVEVTIPSDSVLVFWGDTHFFNENTHHDRARQELAAIVNSRNVFVVVGADLVDGIHWGGESGGEQISSLTQQATAMRSIFRALEGRAIVGVSGEHDSKWAMRTGGDPYAQFSELSQAPYVKGVGEILIHCGDVDYKMVVQHKPRGHSIYNKNHPTFREARFELQGADIYCNFHTHQKQIAQETIRGFREARIVTHLSLGAYKPQDAYGQREGYVNLLPEQMYGSAILLHGDEQRVETEYKILDAIKKWR